MVNLVVSANNFVKLDAFDLTFLTAFSPTVIDETLGTLVSPGTLATYGDSTGAVDFRGGNISFDTVTHSYTSGAFSTLTLTDSRSFPIVTQEFTNLGFSAGLLNAMISAPTPEAFRQQFFKFNDNLTGGSFADVLVGYDGTDTLNGGGGDDKLYGGAGADILMGGNDNDIMDGGAGVDTYIGGAGNDAYYVRNLGADGRVEDLFQELVNDGIDGVNTTVTLNLNEARYNNIENGYLSGTAAINLGGSRADNVLIGNSAANSIYGLGGRDVMQGGGGADKFVFLTATDSGKIAATRDIIQDFVHGSDKIDLGAIDANGSATGLGTFNFQSVQGAAFSGVAGQLHFFHFDNNTIIEGDINGDKIADFQIQLYNTVALTGTDFIL